ncbi:hypothetical protein A2160_02345 [Candidatus Beckwithbacteria bacterium RBG_13_42_9]|uniref:Glycosyl transferase family 1 domain-containing protein n=1 Tax=Candidatus Beckwithbacteria bacterium RBG_13_42_9 TaxID=1797457 RepID=A0A1F5E7C4_9BACT|nr:MAG: hypothetical protein A2160_02345 [Candidatus Beckwithbacteria bacterium RBG_13_42_9]
MLIGIDGNEANVLQRVGANVYAYNILCELHKINSKGDEYRIYLKNKPLDDMPEESKFWQYRVFGPGKLWTQWRLPLELYWQKEKPDIFFTPGHYAPRFCPVPSIISIMDLAFLKFPQDFRQEDLRQLTAWTEYSIKKAAHILTISEATKKDIIELYKIPSEKITVTYPGYDKDKFKTQSAKVKATTQSLRVKYKISENYLLYIGTLQPRKNLVRLVEAFSKIIIQNQQLELVIVGKKGWLYEEIFETVEDLNLEDKVIFTGFVLDDELAGLLSGAQALILPSLYEGFGIPVVEAMACGVPVVVSRTSSLPEIADKAGIYIEDPFSVESIYQALAKVLKLTKTERELLISSGQKQVKKFSWKACASQSRKILEKVRSQSV